MPDVRWDDKAACKGIDPNVFFPVGSSEEEEGPAREVCYTCEVREDCLEFAISQQIPDGIFGGCNKVERKRIIRSRQKQAREAKAS